MNELTLTNFNGVETIDSRLVAEATGKDHAHLMRDIANYRNYLGESKIGFSDFFIESTYRTSQNKEMPCYLCTRKGCEMIANKMTGAKGVTFTAMYINAFHKMEEHIDLEQKHLNALETQARADRAAAMRINAENRRLKLLFDNPQWKDMQLSGIGIETLGLKKVESATGIDVGNALPQTVKTWSATEIGKALGVSSAAIGRKANALGLKTEQNGIFVLDKSRHSNKEVTSFRYNQHGVEALADAFGVIDYTLN
ncbi:MAG: Rha family transcriptional regulator [Ruminococcus sp.]|nr:Rha family transcriptional regulator [Ruminococcus sp.]